ncbi:unnamed protein product [Phaedon cochleariae]|uniref:CUB domain-containing protein n=1 Tax=Phaedon cochleariae TaxID=80249 RepID=A0A9N9SDF4_PHACE|nr:unnamed protein product [Phaedon cochleariae]
MNLSLLLFILFCCSAASTFDNATVVEKTTKIQCGGEFTEKLSILQSPLNSEESSASLDCLYLLKAPEVCPLYYKFEFIKFNLQDSVGCVNERLEIDDQDALCGVKIRNRKYFAKNGSLQLRFKSDGAFDQPERGFKILVTRSDCEAEQLTTTETITTTQYETESPPLSFVPFNIPTFVEDPPRCCQNTFNSKMFLLTSPNFPYSLNKNTECTYVIHKADQGICRVRLNFQFFWMGSAIRNNCPYGYLKVDGKYICGCNRELRLITTFDNSNLKVITFKSQGINFTSQSGFVVEVIQDECPRKYYPADTLGNRLWNSSRKLKFSNDLSNGFDWLRNAQEASVQKLQLVNERSEISDDDGNFYYRDKPKVVKTVYFFAEPDYNALPAVPQDIERTTYVDTESINSIVTSLDQYQCESWNQNQLSILFERYGRNLQTCRQTQVYEDKSSNGRSDCVELDYLEGYFRSPGYPYYYPQNLNMCYRFRKQPGYCAIRILMVDFQLENSRSCNKDFVSLDNYYRHCGSNLNRQTLTIDLNNKPHQDMTFVTDTAISCRGFSGVYRQIACQSDFPPNPDRCPTTSAPPLPSCDRIIPEKNFRIEVSGDNQRCSFRIQKYSEEVCKINVYLEIFDLMCAVESLAVDGMMFCGHISGRKVTLNFRYDEKVKEISYRSSLERRYGNLKFRLTGEQVTDDCSEPEVPVQRLVQLPQDTAVQPRTFKDIDFEVDPNYFIRKQDNQLKDVPYQI